MRFYSNYIIAFLLIVLPYFLISQTASTTSGCAELKVEFTAPENSTYFWDFGDNSFSDLQNPTHSYIQDGDFTVTLYDMEGGTQIGNSILITVYPEIEFQIFADTVQGCVPLKVNFTSQINAHPDITITDIIWTFGEGGTANGESAMHTYTKTGVFTISLKVITENNLKCDEPKLFENFIIAEGASTAFTINSERICEAPAEFIVINETSNDEGATYLWDFGDNETTTERDPFSHIIQEEGSYTICLTTTTPAGCITQFCKDVIVGSPKIDIKNDTICKLISTPLVNETLADEFIWDFSNTDLERTFETDIFAQSPSVYFSTGGEKRITVTAKSDDGCETTEEIIIVVEEPNSNFIYDDVFSCKDSFTVTMRAEDGNMESYTWINKIIGSNGTSTMDPQFSFLYVQPERDEYYYNSPDSIESQLVVKSIHGCIDTGTFALPLQKAEAIFVPDVVTGCIPVDISFSDYSFASDQIITREWDFGDNSTLTLGPNDTIVNHTFIDTGEYLVRLNITDEAGCIDESREVIIKAVEKPTRRDTTVICPDCPPDDAEGNPLEFSTKNCVGDILGLGVLIDTVFNIHFESDEGRFDHCWEFQNGFHTFLFPGEFTIDYVYEIEGIFYDSVRLTRPLVIEGARSEIDFLYDCDKPFEIALNADRCINADVYRWYVNNILVSEQANHSYTFPREGDYTIALEVENAASGCTEHRDEMSIQIGPPEAVIEMDDTFCDNVPYILDAKNSKNAGDGCDSGYQWEFENHRPRKVLQDTIEHTFKPGNQIVTLIVTDNNGCTNSATKEINVYGIEPEINLDSTICLNSPTQLMDLSTSDTSLVAWAWDFGNGMSTDQNPLYLFSELDEDPEYEQDTVTVDLILTDAIGCMDTIQQLASTYSIRSQIGMDNSHNICVGGIINFTAQDFTERGSSLNFSWDFQDLGIIEEQNPSVEFTGSGEYNVVLEYTEISSGCTDMIDTLITVYEEPIADFTSPFDDQDFICYPEQIPFTNTSFEDGPILYAWDFGNGSFSNDSMPVIGFDKGEWEVQFIVRSFYGCSDTISKTYNLIGPQGTFEIDKDFLCPGDELTLTLVDPIDVASFTWDLGDGNQIDNVNPLTYQYNPQSSINMFNPVLIIRADNEGCEDIQEIPINLSSVEADFIDTTGICPGAISFITTFNNPQNIRWTIDGDTILNTQTPTVVINNDKDSIDVFLQVTDDQGCVVERSRKVANPNLANQQIQYPNVFSPNGDNINEFFNIVYDEDNIEGDVNITTFKVYNRWGEVLYDNSNPSQGWNGYYKGEPAPPDVYAYFIEVSIDNCEGKSKKGNITIVR